MMAKLSARFIFCFLSILLSFWKLEGFAILKFNFSESVVQGQDFHVLRHAGLNRTVNLEAKGENKEEFQKHHRIYESKRTKGGGKAGGKGGGGNVAGHRPRQERNAASFPVSPPNVFLSSTAWLHVIVAVILAFPTLRVKLF